MPDEEDSGMLMLSIIVVFTCMYGKGRKWGQWGSGQGTKKGAVDSEHGASKGGGLQLHTKTTIPSKRSIPYLKYS